MVYIFSYFTPDYIILFGFTYWLHSCIEFLKSNINTLTGFAKYYKYNIIWTVGVLGLSNKYRDCDHKNGVDYSHVIQNTFCLWKYVSNVYPLFKISRIQSRQLHRCFVFYRSFSVLSSQSHIRQIMITSFPASDQVSGTSRQFLLIIFFAWNVLLSLCA